MRKVIATILSVILLISTVCLATGTDKKIHKRFNMPVEVMEMAEKSSETVPFYENYAKYCNKNFKIDVTNEINESDIPLFIQWDKRWGYRDFDKSIIGVSGCGPTCLSMVLCGLTKNPKFDPYYVAKFTVKNKFYVTGQGTSWLLMTVGAERLGLNAEKGKETKKYILENLSPETPMICSVKPGDFTTTGHFIVLTGFDENGMVKVNDPNSYANSEKVWAVDALVDQMKAIWKFSYESGQ